MQRWPKNSACARETLRQPQETRTRAPGRSVRNKRVRNLDDSSAEASPNFKPSP
jgi:hypothetical protein